MKLGEETAARDVGGDTDELIAEEVVRDGAANIKARQAADHGRDWNTTRHRVYGRRGLRNSKGKKPQSWSEEGWKRT